MEFLLTVLGVLLVLEGLGPAASPKIMRQTYEYMMKLSDAQLRRFGLIMMIVGAGLVYWAKL